MKECYFTKNVKKKLRNVRNKKKKTASVTAVCDI